MFRTSIFELMMTHGEVSPESMLIAAALTTPNGSGRGFRDLAETMFESTMFFCFDIYEMSPWSVKIMALETCP
jgi:hypothetical protein